MRVLITDGDSRSALAACRSLGRAGHTVVVAAAALPCLAGASRYSKQAISCPDPGVDADGFVASIVGFTRSLAIDVLLPMTEITTLLLSRNRALLPSSCRFPYSRPDSLVIASDKGRVLELARTARVPIPASKSCSSHDDALECSKDMRYPLVMKATRSRIPKGRGWISTRTSYARTCKELDQRLSELPPEAFPILVQERIIGDGIGVFGCFDHGRAVAWFAHRRLREKPASGGVSVLSESIAPPPDAIEHARTLLEMLDWHGVAMVEFKEDVRDKSLRLMEINGRFWGSLQLAISAGVDFPVILAGLDGGPARLPADSYRVGVRCRWLLGDLDSLIATLLHRRDRQNLPPGFPSRARLLWDFLHVWGRDLHYETFTRNDPAPGLLELRRWLFSR